MGTLEPAFAFWVIEQLILIEGAPFLNIEIVAVSMTSCRVGVAWRNLLMANGADGEPPEGIAFIGQKVFTDLHSSCNNR